MQRKFYQTQEFKELAQVWEKRLEQEGLPDIEEQTGNTNTLKKTVPTSRRWYSESDPVRRQAKEEYFRLLGYCTQGAIFDNEIDQMIMTMKVAGAKISEICEALTQAGTSRYRRTVRLIIRKYEARWGIRIWKPEQLKYVWKPKTPIR